MTVPQANWPIQRTPKHPSDKVLTNPAIERWRKEREDTGHGK